MTREEEIQDENYHIAQLNKAYRNLKDHIKAQKEEIASLREIVCAVNDKVKNGDNADFYAWSPFEENHLETMAVDCPVLIPAGWLRQLLSEQEKESQRLRDDIKRAEQRADGVWEENQRLRNLLNRFVIAFAVGDAGHLTLNGRSWSALEDARKELQGDTE